MSHLIRKLVRYVHILDTGSLEGKTMASYYLVRWIWKRSANFYIPVTIKVYFFYIIS